MVTQFQVLEIHTLNPISLGGFGAHGFDFGAWYVVFLKWVNTTTTTIQCTDNRPRIDENVRKMTE